MDNDPFRLSIYWPKEVEQGDYDSGKLIPALERWIASGETWTGPAEFLVAAREGQAREFIAGRRQSQIRHTAQRLLAGDEKAFADARRAGLRVPIGGDPAPLPHFS